MSTRLWQAPDLAERLAADFAQPAKWEWANEFASELSYGRHAGPARGDARDAAVAIVLCWDGGKWSLPLTVRHSGLTHHAGQVSLPGGLIDEGETACVAAAREVEEELGMRPQFDWLGELETLFVYASNAIVTPCVAAIDHWPAWTPQPTEVDAVLRLPLRDLLEAPPAEPIVIQRGPFTFAAPQLRVDGRSAWGATACILGEFRGRLLRIAAAQPS
jgi:8-oxo-dGTP pyrophosphatase MutT (NUDIX family)